MSELEEAFRPWSTGYVLKLFSAEGGVVEINALHVMVRLERTLNMEPDVISIKIMNPAFADENYILNEYDQVELYTTEIRENVPEASKRLSLIFKGEVFYFDKSNPSNTRVFTILAGDSKKVWDTTFVSKTFEGNGASLKEMVSFLVSSMGLSIGDISLLPSKADKILGYSMMGGAAYYLRRLGVDYNFDFTIFNGTFSVVPRRKMLPTPVEIRRGLGIEGTITYGRPAQTDLGINVTTQLIESAYPGVRVPIFRAEVQRIEEFKARRVIHLFDNYKHAPKTFWECVDPDQEPPKGVYR